MYYHYYYDYDEESVISLMHLCCCMSELILLLLHVGRFCWVTWQLLQHSPLLHLDPWVKAHLLQQAPPSLAHS